MFNLVMEKIRIVGTSNLISSKNIWESVSSKKELEFGNFGDLSFSLDHPEDVVASILIVVAADLVDEFSTPGDLSRVLLSLVSRIESRLESSNSPLIVGLLRNQGYSVISQSRQRSIFHSAWREFEDATFLLQQKFSHLFLLSLDDCFADLGMRQALDHRNWYFARCRFSATGLKAIANNLGKLMMRLEVAPKKLLVLDCDNTLWGGIAGDEELTELLLGQDGVGQIYSDFQRAVVSWRKKGILIAVVSKNEEDTVWNVFEHHEGMIIQREDLVGFQINWEDKPNNVKRLQEELDLGLDSIVFWDDNPSERDLMRRSLPEVLTVEVPTELEEWPSFLLSMSEFANFQPWETTSDKTKEYALRQEFKKGASVALDKESYLLSINMVPTAHEVTSGNLGRALQLVSKTNQFNLRTKRMSMVELKAFCDSNCFSFLTSLEDTYGNHGLVGLVLARPLEGNTVFIENFILSCRVFGRNLESWMMETLVRRATSQGMERIIGEFIPSGKNNLVRHFFEDHHFKILSHGGASSDGFRYELNLREIQLPFTNVFARKTGSLKDEMGAK
jgi:FkbH-like protein